MSITLKTLYDRDYALWTKTMAERLRQRDFAALDSC